MPNDKDAASSYRLDGRLAVVTGAAGGLGGAMAGRLAALGATLALVDRNAAAIESVLSRLATQSNRARAISCGVTDEADVRKCADEVRAAFGRCDTYFASDAASYVNGQEILVDGGFSKTSLMRLQPQVQP